MIYYALLKETETFLLLLFIKNGNTIDTMRLGQRK